MTSRQKSILSPAALIYVFVIGYLAYGFTAATDLKKRRQTEFSTFAGLYTEIPYAPPVIKSSEPLLIRLQKSVETLDLKDRSPKWSGKESSQGQPATVSFSVEGVPFDRLALLLERFSVEPNVAVPAFLLERSGASAERFDFSATFIEVSPP